MMKALGLGVLGGLASLLVSCSDLPRDPNGSFEYAKAEKLRVGVIEAPPWVVQVGDGYKGVEVDLIKDFAALHGMELELVEPGHEESFHRLKRKELHIVIGGITETNPWSKEVNFTRAYSQKGKHVMAVPRGENRLLVELETFLLKRRP